MEVEGDFLLVTLVVLLDDAINFQVVDRLSGSIEQVAVRISDKLVVN